MSQDNGFTLLNDEPHTDGDDPLGFDAIADKLAGTILRSRSSTPFTLGIEGGWGSGKSSLMRRLEAKLQEHRSVTTVRFNAWTAEGSNALEGLIKTVLERLDPSVLRRALRNKRLVSGLRLIVLIVGGWFGLGRLADLAWQRVSVDASARNELQDLMREAMERWRSKTPGASTDRLLVVFIDDLDRASPAQVFEIFEAVKLYLDAPGFVFVLGYDQNVISEAVLEEKKYSRTVTGRAYLEKIVQVSYRISPPDDVQANRLLATYAQRSGTATLLDETARSLVLDRNQRNPRRIKRFLNSFVLRYALDADWGDLGPKALINVLLLDIYFPDFMTLFWAQAETDPVTEFLTYRDERLQVFTDNPPGGERDRALQELERQLPEQYPFLAERTEFVALVQSLQDSLEWDDIRSKLERRREISSVPVEEPPAESAQTGPFAPPGSAPPLTKSATQKLDGTSAKILWIDDQPRGNARETGFLLRQGWGVTTVSDGSEARRLLASEHFDALVSDVDRYRNPNAGFEDLASFQESHLYQGPAVFYTGRITPERRERADELGASLTNNPDELVAELQRLVMTGRSIPHLGR